MFPVCGFWFLVLPLAWRRHILKPQTADRQAQWSSPQLHHFTRRAPPFCIASATAMALLDSMPGVWHFASPRMQARKCLAWRMYICSAGRDLMSDCLPFASVKQQ